MRSSSGLLAQAKSRSVCGVRHGSVTRPSREDRRRLPAKEAKWNATGGYVYAHISLF